MPADTTSAAPQAPPQPLCRVHEAVSGALALLRPLIAYHSIDLTEQIEADLPPSPVAVGDLFAVLTACVGQATTNLCGMGTGRQMIVHASKAPGDKVAVEVKDNCTSTPEDGLKQWLAMVPGRARIEDQGGVVTVSRTPEQGSVVRVELPGGKPPKPGSTPARVMVLVDDKPVAAAVSEALRKKGLEVELVSTGFQALTKLAGSEQTLLFVDLQTPGSEPPVLCCELQPKPPPHLSPLIVLSEYLREHKRLLGKEKLTGVPKPIEAEALGKLAEQKIEALRRQAAPSVASAGGAAGSRALLIDHSRAILVLLEVQLKRRGWVVDKVDSAAQALRKLQGATYDLVLLDLELPNNDGASLYGTIAKDLPGQRDRIIASASSADKHKAFLESTRLVCIEKPIQPDKLFTAIEQLTAAPEPTADSPRVLIAAESPTVVGVIDRLLKRRGCVIQSVDEGYKALVKLRKEKFELIVMDIGIRQVDGSILLRAIAKEFPQRVQRLVVIGAREALGACEALFKTHDIPTVPLPLREDVLLRLMEKRLTDLGREN